MSFADSYLGRLRAAMGSVPLISVGIRVLVDDGAGRFLLIRRADNGLWGVIGGSMELGESLSDAAHREAREEANAMLRDLTPFGLSSDPEIERYTYPNGDRVQSVSLMFHAHLVPGDLRPVDGEATELRFVAPDDIDLETMVAPERPIFAAYARFRATGEFQLI
ncbi:NUDIX domain-containing protein [Jannaschia marina]|uniref:NUDIX domain-containing protein n=1 Tax=Jannaschia marina TaxID=2741674 RepID=UPI0015C75448|nr:NUDIX domain-containing protein [Jannaschia marina]